PTRSYGLNDQYISSLTYDAGTAPHLRRRGRAPAYDASGRGVASDAVGGQRGGSRAGDAARNTAVRPGRAGAGAECGGDGLSAGSQGGAGAGRGGRAAAGRAGWAEARLG